MIAAFPSRPVCREPDVYHMLLLTSSCTYALFSAFLPHEAVVHFCGFVLRVARQQALVRRTVMEPISDQACTKFVNFLLLYGTLQSLQFELNWIS